MPRGVSERTLGARKETIVSRTPSAAAPRIHAALLRGRDHTSARAWLEGVLAAVSTEPSLDDATVDQLWRYTRGDYGLAPWRFPDSGPPSAWFWGQLHRAFPGVPRVQALYAD